MLSWPSRGYAIGLRNKLCTLAKGVSRYRREAATHIFVFMISPESRAFKPYAVPVQCVPYVGMKEKKLRELIRAIIRAMVQRGMKVAGEFVQLKNMEMANHSFFRLRCKWRVQCSSKQGLSTTRISVADQGSCSIILWATVLKSAERHADTNS